MPPIKSAFNLQELPKFRDGLSYLYLEHARIEQDALSIAAILPDGMIAVPAASLGVLMLGPGTTVTHAAIKALAQNGCSVQWVGEDHMRFYASGTGETRSSAQLMRQAQAWHDPRLHLAVVRRMYAMRFPNKLEPHLTLQQIRGFEGVRVREAYANASKKSGVPWSGRNYQRTDWKASDPINRALSAGNACLYGVAHAAIISSGYSPGLGFVHTGKQLSFVYDVADLYKMDTVVPAAFEAVSELSDSVERSVRAKLREHLRSTKLLEKIVDDLHSLFLKLESDFDQFNLGENDTPEASENSNRFDTDASAPGDLWDPEGNVTGGTAYGGDDPREGP
jgi:CRISP-associated protein Cas1